MIIYPEIIQKSEQWLHLKRGKAGASDAGSVITPGGKLSKASKGLMRRLARECVCSDPHVWMGNKHTDWGASMEAEAREFFIRETGLTVREYGFALRDDGYVGCSPDGLSLGGVEVSGDFADGGVFYQPQAGDYGLEIKCPAVDTHVDDLMDHVDGLIKGGLPDKHKAQVHWSMAVTGIKTWWFISYFPGLNPLIVEVRADSYTDRVREAQDEFIIQYADERERVLDAIVPGRKKAKMETMEQKQDAVGDHFRDPAKMISEVMIIRRLQDLIEV